MRRAILGSALVVLLLITAAAHASGPPPTGASAKKGVVALGIRYTAGPRGGGGTVVRKLVGGRVAVSRVFAERLAVPAVALDGSASGLSADGRTLVLVRPRQFPARRTDYAVLDARSLRVRDRIGLRGDFHFDAISPDGRTLYLIHYTGDDPLDYAVRAYDVPAHRLVAKPIVDPHEPDEQMRGLPLTRVTSPDGVWAYTLYAGGDAPFIHALDTRDRTARCIDLPAAAAGSDVGAMRMRLGGGRLVVLQGTTPAAFVDARTFRVSEPSAPVAASPPAAVTPDKGDDSGGAPWTLIGALGLACLLAGVAIAVAARRGRGPSYAGSDSPE
jgi:hypothetical protein